MESLVLDAVHLGVSIAILVVVMRVRDHHPETPSRPRGFLSRASTRKPKSMGDDEVLADLERRERKDRPLPLR